ncbi:hypothetical protein JM16_004195 [Phytophthora kernoviae]|uniref:PX domain-containing protein n=1 Tax=Phytophthora kernoviae TaxID=325452 RepID=A0A8T0M131_9STRA|nr:hypothetical protein JM16_004195 [Phytophthora kernoviae]
MREIDARVTGFDYTTFHAYTTDVEVDGHMWTLALRYNTFFQFYTQLTALEKHFNVDFPPKGGLFFSPPPEERQEQLDEFLLSTLAYFDMRGHPKRMEALLGELLEIPQHLDTKEEEEREEEDHTASEGSSVAEELQLDTPMAPGHDNDDDDATDDYQDHNGIEETEEEEHQVQPDDNIEEDNCDMQEDNIEGSDVVEVDYKAEVISEKAEPETKQEVVQSKARSQSEPEPRLIKEESQQLTGGAVAKKYIEMLRRRSAPANGAIQAAVIATTQANVAKAKAAELKAASEVEISVEKETESEKSVDQAADFQTISNTENKEKMDTPELEEKLAAPLTEEGSATPVKSVVEVEITNLEPESALTVESSVDVSETPVDVSPETVERVVASLLVEKIPTEPEVKDPISDTAAKESNSGSTTETEDEPAVSDEVVESSSEESSDEDASPEPSEQEPEAEAENPIMSWFRRMGTFGQLSSTEKEAATNEKEEEEEAATQAQAEAQANSETETKAEEETQAQAEAEAEANKAVAKVEANEAELLRAEQEMNARLMRYRHPVFFQGFNCDVGTSRNSFEAHLITSGLVSERQRGKSLASMACLPLDSGATSGSFEILRCPAHVRVLSFNIMATPQLKTLSAHVTGFDYTSFHAYTTRCELSGASWTLGLRYSQFLSFYDKLRSKEKKFKFDFPPKGGFFFTPKPEDRRVRLDAFLQAVIAFYNSGTKKQADFVAQLLGKFLQVEKNLNKALKSDEQTASDESASEEPLEEPKPKKEVKKAVKVSKKVEDGKKAFVKAAFEAAVVSAIQDNAKEAKKVEPVKKEEVKVEEKMDVKVEKPLVEESKVQETKVEEVKKVEETKKVEEVKKVEETKVEDKKVEETKVEVKKVEETKVEVKKVEETKEVKETKADETKIDEVKTKETKVEETKTEDTKVEETKTEETKTEETKTEVTKTDETKIDETKIDEVKTKETKVEVPAMTTSTSTATARVTETTIESQPSINKTVVGKTMTIVSKSSETHTVKIEMTEQKPSVVTLTHAAKELEKTDTEKTKKKKRSNKKKAKSRSRASTASADGSDSPSGVDDDRVAKPQLSEVQKKMRNQRRKEKRKKNSKKISGMDQKA